MKRYHWFLLFLVVLAVSATFFAFSGLSSFSAWQSLALLETSKAYAGQHPVLARVLFVVTYTLLVFLCVPGLFLLTIFSGVIFGWAGGTTLTALGATLGATLSFLATRSMFREEVSRRFQKTIKHLNGFFENEGFFGLFILRILTIVPYYLVNISAALSGVHLGRFVVSTFLGMMPIHALFAFIGTHVDLLGKNNTQIPNSLLFASSLVGLLALIARFCSRRIIRGPAVSKPAHPQ